MRTIRLLGIQLGLIISSLLPAHSATEPDAGQISISVGRLLEQGHYSRHKLDDEMSRQLLKNYLEMLDYNHLFLTQADVTGFETKYATALDDDILLGNPDPAFDIYKTYQKRVEDRVAKIKDLLTRQYDFSSKRQVEVNRQKSPWPKDDAEMDQLWKDRIEGELLQEKLNAHTSTKPIATAESQTSSTSPSPAETKTSDQPAAENKKADPLDPVKVVTRRYDQVLRNLHEQTNEDITKTFLTCLAQTYDPHSEYMSKSELENFSINMKLSLVGIGAVLHSEDGYAKVMDLVPGGPAQVDGHLKVGDRISAVAQGEKEFVETMDMKLDKVVEMIRGKKGTTVRLQIIPSHGDTTLRKIVEIVRDEVKLKEQEAKAEIIEKEDGKRLGWITLPSFYADMDHSGAPNAKSTTRDVLALLNRLKTENISGLVVDLRRNGGGSLEEAVNLTGLFIKKGPVVQAKDSNGNIHISRDRDTSIAYDGPMIVLTNRLSASASEIFAAALQDYGRAVIVGDQSSFGKGTVQTVVEIGRYIPFLGSDSNDAGALKLTIQKFYRIAGGSTQLKGVVSDIKVPSPYDHPDLGESAMKNPLKYDQVEPAQFDKVTDHPLFIKELSQRSATRIAVDREFRYIMDDLARVNKKIAENKISLNENERRLEMAEEKTRKDKRIADRAKEKKPNQKVFQVTLDNVNNPQLQLAKFDKKSTDAEPSDIINDEEEEVVSKKPAFDPVHTEALNIISDLIEISHSPKTASLNK